MSDSKSTEERKLLVLPFPLEGNIQATLYLPEKLSNDEYKRLKKFLKALYENRI